MITAIAFGGIAYYLARSGKLPMQVQAAQKTDRVVPVTTHAMVLEPLLVNLADAGGSSYLRLGLTLGVADATDRKASPTKDEKDKNKKDGDETVAAARDTVLAVLGRQTADGLLAVDGKQHLKAELKKALLEHNSDLKVENVFFTDFLVQR